MKRLRGRKLQERNKKLARRNPLCVRCKAKGIVRAAVEWDHIIPLYKGGKDEESNLQGLCADCHKDKTREDMGMKPKVAFDVYGNPVGGHPWNRGEGGRNL